MSTRSSIAIKRKDGTIESVYCHSDGYLEYNGVMLNKFYRNPKKINSLINLGDLSFLDRRVNPDPDIPHSFDYDKRQEGVTVAYGRDRNEKRTNKKFHNSLKDYIKSFSNSWQEYAYLYDEENSKWLWSEIPFDNAENMNFASLEDKLNDMGLIESVEPKLDNLIRQQMEFEKVFDLETYNDCYESEDDAYHDFQGILETPQGIKKQIDALKGIIYDIDGDICLNDLSEDLALKFKNMANKNIEMLEEYGREQYPNFDSIPIIEF